MSAEREGAALRNLTRFTPLRELGRGASAVVELVQDDVRGEAVALKRLRLLTAETRFRLKEEFRRVQGVRHPGLVELYDLFVEEGDTFFTMEPIFGHELGHHPESASDSAAPPLSVVLSWLRQLAEAIAALHAAGLVHRDIKPSNVLVEESGRVVLLDYGFCSPVSEHMAENEDRAVIGTMPYMAPERLWGGAPSAVSDWYSFGVLAAELICGRPLFLGPLQDVLRQKDRPPRSLRNERPDLPAVLDGLVCALLQRDPRERPNAAQVLRALDTLLGSNAPVSYTQPVAPEPFLGRQAELGRVQRWFLPATTARVLRISGPSGIGKTTFAKEVVSRIANGPDWLVLRGRCHPKESVPLKALDAVMDELTRHLKVLPAKDVALLASIPGLSALSSLFPVLRRVDAINQRVNDEAEVLDLQERWLAGMRAFRALLGILSNFVKLLVWIDDLHWADRDGMKLLYEAVAAAPRAPTTWLFSLRADASGEVDTMLERLKRQLLEDFLDLRLEGLPALDAAELVLRLGAPATLAPTIVGEAAGSPFFIAELTRYALATGGLVPTTLEQVLNERLQVLTQEETQVLEYLALLEVPVTLPTLKQVAEDAPSLPRVLQQLEQASLIRSTFRGESAEPAVEISHDRIRETVSSRMSEPARRACHAALAAVLAQTPGSSSAVIAYHVRQAGDDERALEFTLKAALECMTNMAFEQAANHYEIAQRLLGARANAHLLERRADALLKAGRCSEAGVVFLQASELCANSEGGAAPARALKLRAGGCFMDAGRIAEGKRALDDVLKEHGRRRPRWPMFEAVRARGRFLLRGARFEPKGQSDAERGERFDVLWAAAKGTVMVEHIAGDAMAVQALLEALKLGDRSRVIQALGHEAASEANIGGPSMRRRARRFLKQIDELANETGRLYDRAWWHQACGAVAWFCADWATAETHLRAALQGYQLHCTGVAHQSNVTALFLLSTLEQRGRFLELGALLPELKTRADQCGDVYASVVFRTGPCVMSPLAEDNPELAQQMCEEGRAAWTAPGFTSLDFQHFIAVMNVHLYRGDVAAGWSTVQRTWPELVRGAFLKLDMIGILLRHIRARAAVQAARAESGRGREAFLRIALAEAAKIAKSELPHAAAWAAGTQAAAFALAGKQMEARERCAFAQHVYDEQGMTAGAAVSALRLAQMAGSEGEQDAERARSGLRTAGVRNPDAMARLLMPFSLE